MAGLTLDAGILIAADRNERRAWALLDDSTGIRILPVVPAVVVAQVWRSSRNANLARFLRLCLVEELTNQHARQAGELCGRAGTDDIVDAAVVASAGRRGDDVVTTDPADLQALAALVPGVKVKLLGG